MRLLKALAALCTLAWLSDLEWRLRRNRASIVGLQREASALRDRLDQHSRDPHAAYIIGQLPRLAANDLHLGLPDSLGMTLPMFMPVPLDPAKVALAATTP